MIRWTADRKEQIARRLLSGDLTIPAAMAEMDATAAEVVSNLVRFMQFGQDGLRQDRCQALRPIGPVVAGIVGKIGGGR